MSVPKYDQLFNPLLESLKSLGGSASIEELTDAIAKNLKLTEEDLSQPHGGWGTELNYRLTWTRSYLKKYGVIDSSARGIFILTDKGKESGTVDPEVVKRYYKGQKALKNGGSEFRQTSPTSLTPEFSPLEEPLDAPEEWQDELSRILQSLPASAFERLCQRLLRESGFVEVRVTGKSGDGGIDGIGIIKLAGFLGFRALFQCKRYSQPVGPGEVRDFQGAMAGRADRGLLITTSGFTPAARKEAARDGAPPIDLVDGEEIIAKLKELQLGVSVELVEQVTIKREFFADI